MDHARAPGGMGRGAKVAVALSALSVTAALVLLAVALVRGRGGADPVPGPKAPERGDQWEGGGVTVTIHDAALDAAGDELRVIVGVATDAARRRVDFRGWRGAVLRARDDAGNDYRALAPDPLGEALLRRMWAERPDSVRMGYGPGSVTAERFRVDAVLLPAPPPGVSHIDLDLSATAVGQRGTIPLRIGRALWRAAP